LGASGIFGELADGANRGAVGDVPGLGVGAGVESGKSVAELSVELPVNKVVADPPLPGTGDSNTVVCDGCDRGVGVIAGAAGCVAIRAAPGTFFNAFRNASAD
jgi:hypothetical protein